jgi:hypothetical protein
MYGLRVTRQVEVTCTSRVSSERQSQNHLGYFSSRDVESGICQR